MISKNYINTIRKHNKQSVTFLHIENFFIFFTEGEPEQLRNCVIQPLK